MNFADFLQPQLDDELIRVVKENKDWLIALGKGYILIPVRILPYNLSYQFVVGLG